MAYLSIYLSIIFNNKPVLGPAAATSEEKDEEKNQDSKSDKERGQRAGQRGRGKRAEEEEEGEDPLLTLFKEDIGYQREADEMREAESRETGLVLSGEKKPEVLLNVLNKVKNDGFLYLLEK